MSASNNKKTTTKKSAMPACAVCAKPAVYECASCAAAFYCGAAHQSTHWTDGGHAATCVPATTASSAKVTKAAKTTEPAGLHASLGLGSDHHHHYYHHRSDQAYWRERFIEEFGAAAADNYRASYPTWSWYERYNQAARYY